MDPKNKAALVCLILIFSSLAGCVSDDNAVQDAVEVIDEINESENETQNETIAVSYTHLTLPTSDLV